MKTTVMRRWAGFAIGLLSFTASHAIEVAMWDSWFGGTHDPWFLNSGRAAAFTMGCLFAASSVAGGLRLRGWPIGAGAVMAMAAVLMWGGGSTIFPIVLAAGGVLIMVSTLLGAWIGSEIRRVFLDRV